MPKPNEATVINRAIGEELRRIREERGWSRAELVSRLPSGVGARTLVSYEHGARQLTMLRFIEICRALGVDSPAVHRRALQRARIHLENLIIRVDLVALLNHRGDIYRPMRKWARNTLNENPDGVVGIEPAVVKNLALLLGCSYSELANHLAQFFPHEDAAMDSKHQEHR
jgi:transcriptional regulator with XRE-family HTH domain